MKLREVLRMLADDGWYHVTTTGSHRQFKDDTKPGKVTVAGHPSTEVLPRDPTKHPATSGPGEES